MTTHADKLVLSLFPGIDLLGRAFEEEGFCVVRGPDVIFGGDIRRFAPPAGHFWGVIGGPPCQDFSALRRSAPTGDGLAMLDEFARVVKACESEWWLMENVARVPDVAIDGYVVTRVDINQAWFSHTTRLRHIQFGSKSGRTLHVPRGRTDSAVESAALANDSRPFDVLCRLQGLPADFDLPPFKVQEKKRAVGNGVPLPMGRALARAVQHAYARHVTVQRTLDGRIEPHNTCKCGCGRRVTGKKVYFDFSCRKRAQRKRDAMRGKVRRDA